LEPYVKSEKLIPEKRFTMGAFLAGQGDRGNLSKSFNASAYRTSNPSKPAYAAATLKAT